ncbi:MAG: cupin domain-containing protein [Pyrinomonadaceae bacterium]|nr:cupin domain-containing protein [Pyrinomonadaceae bacterium]
MNCFYNWREHVGVQKEKFYKTTLWQGEHLMLGMNCLEPGQQQQAHAHDGADKFYFVLEGSGRFTVGNEVCEVEAGGIIIAPARIEHGVVNTGLERLSLLVGITPGIK